MTAIILRGDARNLPLADASVDLICTSPPFYALRSYTDGGEHYAGQLGAEATPAEYVDNLIACTREWMRVLKPAGSIFVDLGDNYSGAQAQNVGGANRAGDSARTWQQTNPRLTGIPNKSLMLLPERYRIACVDQLGLLGRIGIGVDMSADYCRLAQWRTTDPGQYAAALEVDKPARQVDNQGDMLALLEGP